MGLAKSNQKQERNKIIVNTTSKIIKIKIKSNNSCRSYNLNY